MSEFEEAMNTKLEGVETRLRGDLQAQSQKSEKDLRDLERNLGQVMTENKDEITAALHKGDLAFQELFSEIKAQNKTTSALEAKFRDMEASGLRKVVSAAQAATSAVSRPAVEAKEGVWEKYIAPHIAAGLVALIISALVGAGTFILKAQWEAEKQEASKKAEDQRAAELKNMQVLMEALKTFQKESAARTAASVSPANP